jgi:outer membrane protein OmpA-like peptidoglycan-associated protein
LGLNITPDKSRNIMSYSHVQIPGRLSRAVLAVAVLWSVPGAPVAAEQVLQQRNFATRSTQDDRNFVDSLGQRSALTVEDREHVAAIAKGKAAIDLQICFIDKSAEIATESVPQMSELARALASPEFKDAVILIGTFTNTEDSDAHNQALSQRRADSIKQLLVREFRLAAENLVTVGHGTDHTKTDLLADANCRVEIVNLSRE